MKLNRRDFLLLTAGLTAGCQSADRAGDSATRPTGLVNAGPVADYAADGVYSRFQSRGFFLVRQGGKIFALSAICTHRQCKLTVEPNRTFYCDCHGSTFNPEGRVTKGPARRNLPVFPMFVNHQGQLQVQLGPA